MADIFINCMMIYKCTENIRLKSSLIYRSCKIKKFPINATCLKNQTVNIIFTHRDKYLNVEALRYT